MNTPTIPPVQPFERDAILSGPHAQMIAGHLFNRSKSAAKSPSIKVPLPDGDQIVVMTDSPENEPRGGVLLMHGLGGNADARYMVSAAKRLTTDGYMVFRMNHRGAGQGAGLVRRMYNAGLSNDVSCVINAIVAHYPALRLVCVGFSMSGNTILKYAGERGHRVPPSLCRIIAVNPAVDLEQCISAIERRKNRIYHKRFTKLLVSQLTANRAQCRVPEDMKRISSVREYDGRITAPAWGFENAAAYYRQESAVSCIPGIALPTTVLTTDDDPLVPIGIFSEVRWPDRTRLHITRGGGHMGYLSRRKTPLGDRRWMDYFLVYSIESTLG